MKFSIFFANLKCAPPDQIIQMLDSDPSNPPLPPSHEPSYTSNLPLGCMSFTTPAKLVSAFFYFLYLTGAHFTMM